MNDNTCCLCYFHPKEVVVGVCALCLNERLLILASKQEKKKINITNLQLKRDYKENKKKINDNNHESRIHYLPKMFAFTSLLTRRKEIIHNNIGASSSYEGSWEKGAVPKVSLKHCDNMSWTKRSNKVVEIENVAKPRLQLRWRKWIGQIFQLIRLKRSSTKGGASVCHVGTKLDGVKVRHGHGHGWVRTLTKRKTKE